MHMKIISKFHFIRSSDQIVLLRFSGETKRVFSFIRLQSKNYVFSFIRLQSINV